MWCRVEVAIGRRLFRGDLRKGSSIEIVLAKIICRGYTAFIFFIRYVDDRIALSL